MILGSHDFRLVGCSFGWTRFGVLEQLVVGSFGYPCLLLSKISFRFQEHSLNFPHHLELDSIGRSSCFSTIV